MQSKTHNDPYRVTKETFVCPDGEQMRYHALISQPKYNKETGARMDKPVVVAFGMRAASKRFKLLKAMGKTITVLHDPNEWWAENRERIQAEQEKRAKEEETKAKEEADRIQKEKEAEALRLQQEEDARIEARALQIVKEREAEAAKLAKEAEAKGSTVTTKATKATKGDKEAAE